LDLMSISRKTAFTCAAIAIMATFVSLWTCLPSQAQTVVEFTSADTFEIAATNGVIRFAQNGTYESASLENDAWTFVNLRLNYTGGGVNVTISVKNCMINITFCRTTNTTATLRYFVTGQGTQIVKFNHDLKGAEWMPTYNGSNYLVRTRDWKTMPDGAITVTGAPANSNVNLPYRLFAAYLGGNADVSGQSFLQQHSVVIATAIAAAAAVAFALIVRVSSLRKQQRKSSREVLEKIG
jgi:hypothetical protein